MPDIDEIKKNVRDSKKPKESEQPVQGIQMAAAHDRFSSALMPMSPMTAATGTPPETLDSIKVQISDAPPTEVTSEVTNKTTARLAAEQTAGRAALDRRAAR